MAAEEYDTLIVGAGANGTLAANHLLDAGYDPENLAVADPNGYGSELREQMEKIGMEGMRSDFEGSDLGAVGDMGLEEFGYLSPDHSVDGERPSLDLFEDHWDYLVEENSLDDLLYEDAVDDIRRTEDNYEVSIGGETVSAENIVLATGKGGLNLPDYAENLPDEAEMYHAYDDDFSVEEAAEFDGKTYVIGGGITAGQVASSLHENGSDVEMLSRSGLKPPANVEADEDWQDWEYVRSELDSLDYESRKELIDEERYDGQMPGYIHEKIVEYGIAEEGEIEDIQYGENGIEINLSDGREDENIQLVFATGFEPVYESDFYQSIAEDLGMATDYMDMPVLDDETLEWETEEGLDSGIYMMGELAEGSLGPYARNIVGGQIAAKQLSETLGYEENKGEISLGSYPELSSQRSAAL